jgi:ketosteroid isomerase-like protein
MGHIKTKHSPQSKQKASKMMETHVATNIVTDFFAALSRRDSVAVGTFWHDDGTVSAAFNPNGDTGDDAIRSAPHALHLVLFLKNYDEIAFHDILPSVADGGDTIWVETRGDLRVAATGTAYQNRYVFKFTIEGGRIKRLVEYANTVTQNLHGNKAATAK